MPKVTKYATRVPAWEGGKGKRERITQKGNGGGCNGTDRKRMGKGEDGDSPRSGYFMESRARAHTCSVL